MRRAVVLAALSLALASGGLHPPLTRAAEPPKPNVVVILADDLGWADLGCYGSTFHRTPRLDRLAADGLRFTDAYAACPLCSPPRPPLPTRQHPAPRRQVPGPAAPHRLAARPRRPPRPATPPAEDQPAVAAGRGDARRGAEGGGVRHRPRRQVAPRRGRLRAAEAGLRRERRRRPG